MKIFEKIVAIIKSPYQFFKLVCFCLGFLNLVFFAIIFILAYSFFSSLPKVHEFTFNDLKGRASYVVNSRFENKALKHNWVPLSEISRDAIYAVVASEDSNFFSHSGINLDSILSSTLMNIKKKEYVYGASTIDQQVVKNIFLTNEKSIKRKLSEILITKKMNDRFSKNEILEIYLNVAEFGPDIFGLKAAADKFYGKLPKDLNAAEAAMLSLMLPAPRLHFYTIFQKENLNESNRKKLKRIFQEMSYKDYITPKEYEHFAKYNYFAKKNPKN